jgi:predicted nucleic acid-binding protein
VHRVLIDANVVISFLHRRVPRQQRQAAKLFESAIEQRVQILLHQHVLAETVCVLLNVYQKPAADVAGTIADLIAMPGVERNNSLSDTRLLDLWPNTIRDFGDAVSAAVAQDEPCCVATFDAKLRRALTRLDIPVWSW